MTVDDLLVEALLAKERFWFVQTLQIKDRTDATITLHFYIDDDLLVQLFYSQRSERLSLALVGPSGRLYGRDKERGIWHLHPFGETHIHQPTPEGFSPKPITQFLSEIERILTERNLI